MKTGEIVKAGLLFAFAASLAAGCGMEGETGPPDVSGKYIGSETAEFDLDGDGKTDFQHLQFELLQDGSIVSVPGFNFDNTEKNDCLILENLTPLEGTVLDDGTIRMTSTGDVVCSCQECMVRTFSVRLDFEGAYSNEWIEGRRVLTFNVPGREELSAGFNFIVARE